MSSNPPPLTPRLVEVLAGAAAGERIVDTAARLYVSTGTVRKQRDELRSRLGARSVAQAVALGYEAGYLPIIEPNESS